jgi:uncharacterized caspase-like protein
VVLAVGINKYAPTGLRNLLYPVDDAQEIVETFKGFKGGKLFDKVTLITLYDRDATKSKILNELGKLANLGPDDRLVLFLAGHGSQAKDGTPQFFFCTGDYDREAQAKTGLSSLEMYSALANLRCRKLVLIDACHSGGVLLEKEIKGKRAVFVDQIRSLTPENVGPAILAASTFEQFSEEDPALGHGLFTYSVLEVLGKDFQKVDITKDGFLNPREMHGAVSDRVPRLCEKLKLKEPQQPQARLPRTEELLPWFQQRP